MPKSGATSVQSVLTMLGSVLGFDFNFAYSAATALRHCEPFVAITTFDIGRIARHCANRFTVASHHCCVIPFDRAEYMSWYSALCMSLGYFPVAQTCNPAFKLSRV